jgi:hypothetical protein
MYWLTTLNLDCGWNLVDSGQLAKDINRLFRPIRRRCYLEHYSLWLGNLHKGNLLSKSCENTEFAIHKTRHPDLSLQRYIVGNK